MKGDICRDSRGADSEKVKNVRNAVAVNCDTCAENVEHKSVKCRSGGLCGFEMLSFAAFATVFLKARRQLKDADFRKYIRLCACSAAVLAGFCILPEVLLLAAMRITEASFKGVAEVLDKIGIVYMYISGIICTVKLEKHIGNRQNGYI